MYMMRGPLAMCALLGGCVGLCGCIRCAGVFRACRLRNCALLKHFLLCIGYDSFDDFELMVLVHDATFTSVEKEKVTVVQATAGAHTVRTNPNPNSVFQQPLHILVEQGTEHIVVELLSDTDQLLATMQINVNEIHNDKTNLEPEISYAMQQKSKGCINPRIKLTMAITAEEDGEMGFQGDGKQGDRRPLNILVRQQLKKAKQMYGGATEGVSEMDVLKEACTGPLELFKGLAQSQRVWVAVTGPPKSKKWALGLWMHQADCEAKDYPVEEVPLLKIQSIQPDPQRNHVFVLNCVDQTGRRQSLTFRRVDRSRDVWVEILHLLVLKAREQEQAKKESYLRSIEGQEKGVPKEKLGFFRKLRGNSKSVARPASPRPSA